MTWTRAETGAGACQAGQPQEQLQLAIPAAMGPAPFAIGPRDETPGATGRGDPGPSGPETGVMKGRAEPGDPAQGAWESLAAFLVIFLAGLGSAAVFPL